MSYNSLYVSDVKPHSHGDRCYRPRHTSFQKALHDVGLVLIVLRIAVLRCSLARQFSIDGIATPLEHESTTLEILSGSILSLILALRVCA